jgi:EAL domain-containing protein (putative c-di-GMP-specific phosphodiesterase class I)
MGEALKLMDTLRTRGCVFALDDFGSGMSSFGYLKSLPVDYLKIEGDFIKEILSDETSLAIVKTINEIGHVMGKRTIAEFVENDAVLARIRDLGVDYAQGYGISRPMPLEEVLAGLETPVPGHMTALEIGA